MSSLVQISGSKLSCSVETSAQAKTAVKELKLIKKGYALDKKAIATKIRTVRFEYSQNVKSRGSLLRGGGGIGRFFRAVQTVSRDSQRAGLASSLAPLEAERHRLDTVMHSIEEMIVMLEIFAGEPDE